jgi:plastocyanin
MKRSVLAPLAVTIGLFGVSACGGGGTATPPADADLTVYGLDSLIFDQEAYTATAGQVKIAFANRGSINHTLLVVGAEQKVFGDRLEIGGNGVDSALYDLPAGRYILFCDIPGHGNMKSDLTVS